MNNDQVPDDFTKPVAYDAEGRPLYAHPPAQATPPPPPVPQPAELTTDQPSHVTQAPVAQDGQNFDSRTRVQYGNEPAIWQVTRPKEPSKLPLSEEVQQKNEESRKKFPALNLSDGEYVMLAVRRHPIGLVAPIGSTVLALVLIFGLTAVYTGMTMVNPGMPASGDVILISILLALLVTIFGYFATWIYIQNKFYLTNESVVQEVQHSLFSKREQTVSLGSIEDASFRQTNFIQTLFDYGTIRLSTEGDETTYRFQYVAEPKKQVAVLNNAIEAFKNGRPVDDDIN
ncbi:MAG: hypothetical protein JWO61_379 [Candidatus Saccharibacteria bacterium]|nr:hypothetical protein [Candidatus Saccharibacteria bacterium]